MGQFNFILLLLISNFVNIGPILINQG